MVVAIGSSWAEAVARVVGEAPIASPVLVLPSSLRRADPVAAAVRTVLRARDVESHLLIPASVTAALTNVRLSPTAGWVRAQVRPPDVPSSSIELPARLAGIPLIWSVTDIDAVRGRGPYVLDLIARYLHPVSRLKLLASPRREDAVVDVNLIASPARCVIGMRIDGSAIAASVDDPIAGELVALALADELMATGQSATGPWEERVVQRATELQLGIRIPADVSVVPSGKLEGAAFDVVRRASERIGIAFT